MHKRYEALKKNKPGVSLPFCEKSEVSQTFNYLWWYANVSVIIFCTYVFRLLLPLLWLKYMLENNPVPGFSADDMS